MSSRKIVFELLRMSNFRSIAEEVTIDFASLGNTTFVNGINRDIDPKLVGDKELPVRNGAGKSTIIDGILFALYGRTVSGSENSEIQNRKFKGQLKTYSKLNFRIGEDKFEITSNLLTKGKNKVVKIDIVKNGGKPMELNTPQAKNYIESEILGCGYDLFKSAIIISEADYINFYDLKKSEKVAYVEKLFNLDCFSELLKLVRSDLNATKNAFNETNALLITSGAEFDQLKLKNDTFLDKQKEKVDGYRSELLLVERVIKALQKDVPKIPELDVSEWYDYSDKYNDLMEKKRKLEDAQKTIGFSIGSSSEKIEKYSSIIKLVCEDCLSSIDGELNLTGCQKELNDNQELLKKIEGALTGIKEKESEYDTKIKSYEKLDLQIKENEKKTELIENTIQSKNELADKLEELISEAEKLENPFADLIESLQTKLSELQARLKRLGQLYQELQAMEIMAGEKGVKAVLLSDISVLINKILKKYLDLFGNQYAVKFDSQFEPNFVTATGKCSLKEFSAGEKQRINLATIFSFRDLITNDHISSNLFILDEILDGNIDSYAISGILDALRDKAISDERKNIIISHNPDLTRLGSFDSQITAIKEDGATTYNIRNFEG